MTEYPLLCLNAHCRPEDQGGPRRTERAWFCPTCIEKAGQHLHHIAETWADLEEALMQGGSGHGEPVGGSKEFGLVLNERAAAARAKATTDLWSYARMVFDWADEVDRSIASPGDQTPPGLAVWLADWHLSVFTVHAGRYTAVAFMDDVWAIRSAVHGAAYPSGAKRVETGLRCTEHGTSVEGERVPCEGEMVAWIRPDAKVLPDLVCTEDRQHTIDPVTWRRAGLRGATLDPAAATRLANAMTS